MNTTRTSINSNRSALGFTIIEILMVILIILALAGVTIGITGYVTRQANISRAKAQVVAIEMALDAYKADFGHYPISTGIRPTTHVNATTNCYALYRALCGPAGKVYLNPATVQTVAFYGYVSGSSTWRTNDLPAIVDPFKRPFGYYCTNPVTNAQKQTASFDLWSFGPDGRSDSTTAQADDITNWAR